MFHYFIVSVLPSLVWSGQLPCVALTCLALLCLAFSLFALSFLALSPSYIISPWERAARSNLGVLRPAQQPRAHVASQQRRRQGNRWRQWAAAEVREPRQARQLPHLRPRDSSIRSRDRQEHLAQGARQNPVLPLDQSTQDVERIDGVFSGPKTKIDRDWSIAPLTLVWKVRNRTAVPPPEEVASELGEFVLVFSRDSTYKIKLLQTNSYLVVFSPRCSSKVQIVVPIGLPQREGERGG